MGERYDRACAEGRIQEQQLVAREREKLRIAMEARDDYLRVTPERLAAAGIECSPWYEYAVSTDGSVGSVRVIIDSDPSVCLFAHFDADDLDNLAPYRLLGRWRRGKCLQVRLSGGGVYSVGRLLLGIDDPAYRVGLRNRNQLDCTRGNLITYEIGKLPAITGTGPDWKALRQEAWDRAQGRCEVCHKKRAACIHQCVPVQDAGSLFRFIVTCNRCHELEHQRISAPKGQPN